MRFLTFAITGLLVLPGFALFSVRPAHAADDTVVLNLQDSTGQTRQMICRPAHPGEIAPASAKTVRTAPTPAKPASAPPAKAKPTSQSIQGGVTVTPLPDSPAVARPTPGPTAGQTAVSVNPAGAAPVAVREIQSGGSIRNCPPPPPPSQLPTWQLYADPATVAAAWQCYAPRQMATSPRPWIGPDPAVHSPLPPLQKVASPRSTRRSTPAKPAQAVDPANPGPPSISGASRAVPSTVTPAMPAPSVTQPNRTTPGALPSAAQSNAASTSTPSTNTQASAQAATTAASPTESRTTANSTGASGIYSGSAPNVP